MKPKPKVPSKPRVKVSAKQNTKEPKKSKAEVRAEQIVKVVTAYKKEVGNELFHTLDEEPWARTQVKGSNFVKGHFENLEIKKNGKLQRLLRTRGIVLFDSAQIIDWFLHRCGGKVQ